MDLQKQREGKRQLKAEQYKKFKGNKKEGQGFADKRKKKVQYEYLKMLRKEKKKRERTALPHTSFEDTDMTEEKIGKEKKIEDSSSNTYSKSQKQFSKKKMDKEKKKKEVLKQKREIESALTKYKDKKSKQYKKLCKKTYKGQPVMKNQIEILLHKIQSGIDQT
ncbi:thyroid transcription factor 1-associated protein 26 homolog [Mytilus trossulus]|uniref:thyroid transcription factor 1-associated protein 26 homolog n=1 Tax=Mytilus trossulus TaxID=6551 RepID=UPI003006BA5F